MKNILQINSSIFAGEGQSTRLASRFTAELQARYPGADLVIRDLAANPVPHLDAGRFGAFLAKPAERSAEQQAAVACSDALIDELRRADAIVIGLPMYNFGLPSQLKAWIDHVARAGVTFKYTEKGAVGLLTGKRAWVFATRGGRYAGTPADTQTAYVRDFLAFVGITDVEFVYAEGLAMGEAPKNEALAAARSSIRRIGSQLRIAA